ncbi:MAG: lipid A deacylase LpxR family protein [Burkholderiaceae bacterium]|nr:lipid A deacylase LpxR family protein [Burkholderiaceae bacterium]MBP7660331.1 lipid A deacylase LpxR family protein [Burkholderiaceae bacterium]
MQGSRSPVAVLLIVFLGAVLSGLPAPLLAQHVLAQIAQAPFPQGLAAPARPETSAPGKSAGRSLSVQFDNDEFAGLNRRDRWYSQAFRIHYFAAATADSWAGQAARRWCDWQACAPGTDASRRWSLGQNAYTQNDRNLPAVDPYDRPTAGWLYASGALLLESASETRMLELQLGVIGPASGAERLQNRWHSLLGVDSVRGWSSQLRPRAGVQLQLLQERRYPLLGDRLDLVGRASLSIGSVSGQASVGAVLRLGDRLAGTATAAEAQAATGRIASGGLWSVQAGVALRGVAYDRLIDGPAFGYDPQVRHAPWVGEVHLGATLAPMPDWHLRFALIRRSIDFDSSAVAQGRFKAQTFGVIQASVVLR